MRKSLFMQMVAVLACASCGGETIDPGNQTAVGSTVSTASALDLTQPISVRVISIANSSCRFTKTDAQNAVDLLNVAGGDSGLKFQFYRFDHYPLPKQQHEEKVTASDMASMWEGLGLSADVQQQIIAKANPGSSGQTLHLWLDATDQIGMPHSVIAWQACNTDGIGMYMGGYVWGVGDFTHEMGHGFGLHHSFEVPTTESEACSLWDLVYAARGRGLANRYFTSEADCDNFFASQSYDSIFRVDGRNDDHHAGLQRHIAGGIVTVQHPRCSSCGTDLGFNQPADDGVERYTTGDAQINGYVRYVNGTSSINAMSYCSSTDPTVCPPGTFYSAAQIVVMQATASNHSWVFTEGKPVAFNQPASCGYLSPDEGLIAGGPWLYSCAKTLGLTLDQWGNLGLYSIAPTSTGGVTVGPLLWSVGPLTGGTDTTDLRLLMQQDGNLVVYDRNQTPVWATGTVGHPGAYVKLSDTNGDMKVRTADGSSYLWKAH